MSTVKIQIRTTGIARAIVDAHVYGTWAVHRMDGTWAITRIAGAYAGMRIPASHTCDMRKVTAIATAKVLDDKIGTKRLTRDVSEQIVKICRDQLLKHQGSQAVSP